MPRRDAELKARLLATFQVEADEHLVALRRHLLALADGAGPELVETAFRDMHTLKGAARSVGPGPSSARTPRATRAVVGCAG